MMGVGEVDGPPKKKLKQAQLTFCTVTSEKTSNKRKLNPTSPDGALKKVFRKDSSTTPKPLAFNKENVKINIAQISTVNISSGEEDEKPKSEASVEAKRDYNDKICDNEGREDSQSRKLLQNNEKIDGVDTTESSEVIDLSVENDVELTSGTSVDAKRAINEKARGGGGRCPDDESLILVKNDDEVEKVKLDDSPRERDAKKQLGDLKVRVEKEAQCTTGVSNDTTVQTPQQKEEEKNVTLDGVEMNQGSLVEEKPSSFRGNENDEELQCLNTTENEGDNQEVDLDSSNDKLEQSIDSDQGDLNASICLSSDNEADISSLSTKKGLTTPNPKKAVRAKLREEKTRLKSEKGEVRRQKREEREKKRQEHLKMKEEARKQREHERRRREEAKEEERRRKEDERKRKDEMKEEERKRKEEAKEEERKKKEEEKKKKEESKEEDRRKKEEARLAEERKESLAKQAFTKFFILNKSKLTVSKEDDKDKSMEGAESPKFMPFPVKADMRLAVPVRYSISDEKKKVLSEALDSSQPTLKLYLDEIKGGLRKPCKTAATWPLSEEQHDVIIVESVSEEKSVDEEEAVSCVKSKRQRAKLLQFHDNRRPPYWGTWRKKSRSITPRRPLGKDQVFDYEVDSDSEWEDEDEGEDIDKEGESDKEQSDDENVGENGYLLDNTFVPHGYLSDEEAAEEENLNPEDQKLKMKALKQEFEQELKSKAERLKPRLLGCVWISNETTEVSKGSLYETLMNYRCKWDEGDGSIDPSGTTVEATPSPSPANAKFPSSKIEYIVNLVHGSRLSHINLVTEFMSSLEVDKEKHLSTISKRAVSRKIKEIAYKTPNSSGRLVWTVNPKLRAEYNLPNVLDSPKTSPATVDISPKPKDGTLVNFLRKGSTPQRGARKRLPSVPLAQNPGSGDGKPLPEHARKTLEASSTGLKVNEAKHEIKKRVIPTLISSVTTSSQEKPSDSSTVDSSKTPSTPAREQKKRIIPSLISSTIATSPHEKLAESSTEVVSVDSDSSEPSTNESDKMPSMTDQQNSSTVNSTSNFGNSSSLVPANAANGVPSQATPGRPPVRKRIVPIRLSKTVSQSFKTKGSSPLEAFIINSRSEGARSKLEPSETPSSTFVEPSDNVK